MAGSMTLVPTPLTGVPDSGTVVDVEVEVEVVGAEDVVVVAFLA
jgi:hypothetical protein